MGEEEARITPFVSILEKRVELRTKIHFNPMTIEFMKRIKTPRERRLLIIKSAFCDSELFDAWKKKAYEFQGRFRSREVEKMYFQVLRASPNLMCTLIDEKIERESLRARIDKMHEENEDMQKKAYLNRKSRKLANLEASLNACVIGQETAVHQICSIVQQVQLGLYAHLPPAFLLAGPSGSGKTSLVDNLNRILHGEYHDVMKINGADYAASHEVSKLLGSPPGYIGHEDGGRLDRVKKNPELVVLIDEMEKGHEKLADTFLGILDDGFAYNNKGEKLDFRLSLFFATTNVGTSEKAMGFMREETKKQSREAALKKGYKTEVLNRFHLVYFRELKPEHMAQILELEIRKSLQHHMNQKVKVFEHVYFTQVLKQAIIEKGYSSDFGARELGRVIDKMALAPLAVEVARNIDNFYGKRVLLDYKNGKTTVTVL